ncbi:hypothetical protein JHK82_042242 [Glycine max]|nr:hypothetical protein JHK86_042287 [Glycine max]KAG4956530.1 hypothetical protein JHK85_042910 [Glycine max]KAG5105272.1 hypothetical protein JHK82_042242 [Glycine max]KAG5116395.1 hypothetical protein JHK84_042508 [Glycine max]
MAAVLSMLQHSTCLENLAFHFLSTHDDALELFSSIKSTFPYLKMKIYRFDSNRVHGKISKSIRQALDQPLNYARIYLADTIPEDVKHRSPLLLSASSLFKQRSWSSYTFRNEAWLRHKGNWKNRCSKSVTDEDVDELKACNLVVVSLGSHLYVLNGSFFDTCSFPIDRPSPSSAMFCFSFHDFSLEPHAQMLSPRGSFACAMVPARGSIYVAGGGSRHTMFGPAGSRIRSVEQYEVGRDRWVLMENLPGCVGFVGEEGRELWVIGGYGVFEDHIGGVSSG